MSLQTKFLSIGFFAFSFIGFAQSNCVELKGCERKLCELNTKLAAAKKVGNSNQIKGIEKAISQTTNNCTAKTVNKELDNKVKEKEKEVKERTDELNQAIKKQEGKQKIDKKRKKLSEAKSELNQAVAAKKAQ